MSEYTDPMEILHKIDYEGWPDALEWFGGDQFEDPTIRELLDRALDALGHLGEAEDDLLGYLEEKGYSLT